jgi:hypothetical protein
LAQANFTKTLQSSSPYLIPVGYDIMGIACISCPEKMS